MSKGSAPRSRQVGRAEYERRWDGTFVNHGPGAIVVNGVEIPPDGVVRAFGPMRQADGDPGDENDYAVERAGA